ncbi:MAG: hypothetical protein DRJ35_04095 [Thermoprotei archaeon]|nr:MAG: hypothetical protein DRJ35_04095 [Thermoprotei archaeon]
MDEKKATLALIRSLFRKYYRDAKIMPPPKLEQREFAFIPFDAKGMIRHISFNDAADLKNYILSNIPRHVYYSSSYYENPAAERMDEKGWLGADLIFDIDVDHIDTPCKVFHDRWHCRECGASGWGFVTSCPKCGSERISRDTWVCRTCINVAKDELIKLIEFLESDFGISRKEMYAVFSGHRGFHLHVENKAVIDLDQDARREIADYVRGVGIDPPLFLKKIKKKFVFKYDILTPGWPGRIARYLLFKYGENDPDFSLEKLRFSLDRWKKIINDAIDSEKVVIDEKVTIDIKRLIRLPQSLHGKTGLKVLKIDIHELEEIDVIEKSKVFTQGDVIVSASYVPRRILNHEFSENINSSNLRVPLYLGIYLALNGDTVIKGFV